MKIKRVGVLEEKKNNFSSDEEFESSNDEPEISDPPKRNLPNSNEAIKGHKSNVPPDTNENYALLTSKSQMSDDASRSTIHTNSSSISNTCHCCPIHKIEMEKLNTLICTLQGSVSENIKILMRKQNILSNIVTDAVGEIRTISEGIQKIQIENQSEYNHESVFNKFPFPINTMEKFKQAENFWSEESNFRASVQEFSKIGGNSTYEFVKRVMSLIISNNLAASFTWFGTKSKDSLMKSKLAEVLLRAADHSTISCDRKMVGEAARKYLRRAKERSVAENRQLDSALAPFSEFHFSSCKILISPDSPVNDHSIS